MAKSKTPPPAPPTPAPGATPPLAPAPAAAVAPPAIQPTTVKETDPVELQLLKSRNPVSGDFLIFARVLNVASKGLGKKIVVFVREGEQKEVPTDKNGRANYPTLLTPPSDGSKMNVSVSVSGISDRATIQIYARRPKSPAQQAKDSANNWRGMKFTLVGVGACLTCLLIVLFFGLGKPLIDKTKTSIMPQPRTSLTENQVAYNNSPGVKGTYLEIKLPAPIPSTTPTGRWQKPIFLATFLWTAFSVVYWFLSFREEAVEAFRHGVEKIIDKRSSSASAKDPFFERLMAFSGHLASARKSSGSTPEITPPGAPAPSGKNTFWELFRSDLLSEFVTEILPGVLKAIFKR